MEAYTTDSGTAGRMPPAGSTGGAGTRATVRTYRHGSGDIHLLTLRGEGATTYRILIVGGVAPVATGASAAGEEMFDDILEETGGYVDLLVDFPGFVQYAEALAKLDVGELWLPWTENPADPQAHALHEQRERALDKLRLAAAEVQLRGTEAEARAISSLLAYYGIGGRTPGGDPLAALRARTPALVYCRPGDGPRELPGVGARIYLYGPPSGAPGLAASRDSSSGSLALDEFVHNVMPNLEGNAVDNPFSTLYSIPEAVARSMPFFQEHYWEDDPWRRIDMAWITDATQYALVLDSLTTSTSLGLAIELDGGDVLLFAPEGESGTGLSADQQVWSAGGGRIGGRDLLARTVFYKVGHHGGLDTARPDGLQLMPKLRVAIIPADAAAALAPNGADVPIDALQHALAEGIKDRGYVLRTDQDAPAAALDQGVTAAPGYFDVQL